MKFNTPNQWYVLTAGLYKGSVVRPFNAEIEKYRHRGALINDASWSNGITHCKDAYGCFVFFCGVDRFEEIATECNKPKDAPNQDIDFNFDTEENNMSALTPEQQQIVNRVSQDAVNSSVDDYEVVYKTDDGFIFSSEAAVDSYNAFGYILDTVDPELLRATMAAYFEALHGN
jgi:hypothetical protein